jgi:UDP-N-acetylmuramyl tripeptide synthase
MEKQAHQDQELVEAANDLYWRSDASVNHIADEMGLSKGSLYGLISPLPSGISCPQCGAEMAYPNRTARDRGFVSCPVCGFEEEEGLVDDSQRGSDLEVQRRSKSLKGALSTDRILAGTALLGVAVGILIANLLRKR